MTATVHYLRPAPVVVLVPTEDAVWFAGGSLHIRYGSHVRHLDPETALERRAFWHAQARRYGHDPQSSEATLAARRWSALTEALDQLDAWNVRVGKPSPYPNPSAEVAERLSASVEQLGNGA